MLLWRFWIYYLNFSRQRRLCYNRFMDELNYFSLLIYSIRIKNVLKTLRNMTVSSRPKKNLIYILFVTHIQDWFFSIKMCRHRHKFISTRKRLTCNCFDPSFKKNFHLFSFCFISFRVILQFPIGKFPLFVWISI